MEIVTTILVVSLVSALVALLRLGISLSEARTEAATQRAQAENALQTLAREADNHAETLRQQRADAEKTLAAAKADAAAVLADAKADAAAVLAAAKADAAAVLAAAKEEYAASLARQRGEFDAVSAAMEERFKELAAKALADNAEQLRRQNRNGLAEVLEPMKGRLDEFSKSITEHYGEEARQHFSLNERVRELIALNNTIGTETRRLTDAIRGNSRMQGDWGEMILDNILSQAGLRQGYEYTVQTSVTGDDGRRLRPDVVINCADGRKIVVDSKVSIQDYIKMLNADTDDARRQYAQAHVASVRKHISELKNKDYQSVVGNGTLDCVLMFIPHEGAFLAALDIDNQLWQTAFDNHVLMISPTHLMSIVKLIEQMWRHDRQNANALKIADEAGKLLEKLAGFLADMDTIDKSIGTARKAWDAAFGKLTSGPGNIMRRAQNMQSLGAKAKKALPERYAAADGDGDGDGGDNEP